MPMLRPPHPPPPPEEADAHAYKRDFKSNVKLESLETLEGKHNYEDWVHQLPMIFEALGATEVVLNGYQPDEFASQAEKITTSTLPKNLSSAPLSYKQANFEEAGEARNRSQDLDPPKEHLLHRLWVVICLRSPSVQCPLPSILGMWIITGMWITRLYM